MTDEEAAAVILRARYEVQDTAGEWAYEWEGPPGSEPSSATWWAPRTKHRGKRQP